ncbi:hypothetical protein ES332_A06G135700v1 [Gossypium tomentosum]|uniref:glucan endo-1,3-beta-D-glucosidase n=1 Tax=Gossypium tomentosum TaxID=34277 RepID=A0A5D2Q6Y5_GOSTO|nr:hypothetical protein ES332_A06G135700v1 [Gossypium tomentosum]
MDCNFFDYLPTSHMASSFFLLLFLSFSLVCSHAKHSVTWTYGISYGRIADNLPAPETVVTLLKAAKVNHIRIYDADHGVLTAFNGSGIEIIVGLPNGYLKEMSTAEDRSMNWVRKLLLPSAKNIYGAVYRLGLKEIIQVSSPHSEAVFANSFPPSACIFKPDVVPFMKPLLHLFSQIGSPFYINAYPFLAYKNDPQHIDINYALFKDNPQVDAAYSALEKAGFNKMEVIISETGWASRGDPDEAGATVKNARTYNRHLRKRLTKKKGTPLRPKIPVRAYVFALFNENSKPGPTSERNFGLFKPDGSIAYDIGFTGLVPSSAPPPSFKDIAAQGWLR